MSRIVLENVTKKFGKFVAVDNLNLIIEDRSFITFLGPSGCGKTTTLRMIAGLETPTQGKITIDDVVVFDSEAGINISPAKRDVGFLFQNYALWPHMTVYKNISFGLEQLKWKKEDIKNRVDELLKLLKIEEFVKRYPGELSGGQQQRVAIARTLAPRPKIMFMDEPLSNLDAKLRLEMRTELKRLHKETNSTFVYVTHDQLEAMTLATKVCLMREGIVEQYDNPLTTYAHPNNTFSADFVGNPTINFSTSKLIVEKDKYFITVADKKVEFIPNEKTQLTNENVIVGIRPEHIRVNEKGFKAVVYSSLPSGMETIVILKNNDTTFTSVVFGIIDFEHESTINFNIVSNNILLFDEETGIRISEGSLKA